VSARSKYRLLQCILRLASLGLLVVACGGKTRNSGESTSGGGASTETGGNMGGMPSLSSMTPSGGVMSAGGSTSRKLRASSITASPEHTCAVLNDSSVQCWGWDQSGMLGEGTPSYNSTPATLSGITTAIGIAAGDSHTCALMSGGTVQCWGQNGSGELGNGSMVGSTPGQSHLPCELTA
jgi:hypothetical protein